MTEDELFKLKDGDKFVYPNRYVNTSMVSIKHNYRCVIMSVIVDDDALQGFTIKRYLKVKQRWSYEFFDVYKVLSQCEIN